jgi:hypothetical protein
MPYITSSQTPALPSDTHSAPEPTTPGDAPDRVDTVDTRAGRPRFLGLSLTQVLGGSLAATTAAFLGARLGLAGTLVGAAIASVVSAIATAAYAHSIDRTRHFLKTTRVVATTTTRRADAVDPATPPREVLEPARPPRTLTLDLRRVGMATLAVFAATVVAITGYEFASGHSLDGKQGTTVSQVVGGSQARTATTPKTSATTPVPTATVTVTTTAPPTSPTETQTTAPTSTTTSAPVTSTGTSTPDPTGTSTAP